MKKNILTIIGCHTNSSIRIKALIYNIKYFLEISSCIAIVNSLEFKSINLEERIRDVYKHIVINDTLTDDQCYEYKNRYDDLKGLTNDQLRDHWYSFGKKDGRSLAMPVSNIYFDYIENDKFVCHGKWTYYLNKIDYTDFGYIILTNDSIIVTRSLFDFKKLIYEDKEMTALSDSNEVIYHYPDFLRAYNIRGIKKILNHYESNKEKITDFQSVIYHYEINSSHIFNSVELLYRNDDSNFKSNIHFDECKLKEYLYKKNYPIIKIKKLLMCYYHTNDLPVDFNSQEYISLHPDLNGFSSNDAILHFLIYGVCENRIYKRNQHVLPIFLDNYLKLIRFDM